MAGRNGPPINTRKEQGPMTTQVALSGFDMVGVIPAMLVVLLTILAMLGIVAAVAAV
jgi:hypothetical protein